MFVFSSLSAQEKIDINKADLQQLKALPGIGEATAKAIIELRDKKGGFKSIDELKEVKGIGDKKLEVLKQYLTVGGQLTNTPLSPSLINESDQFKDVNRGKIYMYRDEKGILHYTQFPETVPEKYRKSLKPVN
ncbi:MAG: ComEA family DNA-binding protein [Caldimicrobium sp.]